MPETEFLFPGPIWFIAPKVPYHNLDELCQVILHGILDDKASGKPIRMVYVFSDRDLAERFLQKAGPQASPYVPVSMRDDGELIDLLEGLQSHGHRYLGADAEQTATSLVSIHSIIDQIRRRQGPGASPPGSVPPD